MRGRGLWWVLAGREGREYADDRLVERDFAQTTKLDTDIVRIPHTVPPRALLYTTGLDRRWVNARPLGRAECRIFDRRELPGDYPISRQAPLLGRIVTDLVPMIYQTGMEFAG
jgi:hypothetical protein